MNLRYLGDAMDYWKGALLSRLVQDGALVDLGIYPVATDAGEWSDSDYRVYADLLRVPVEAILRLRLHPHPRIRILPSTDHKGDAFLDPDTGVATGRVRAHGQYVYPVDIVSLLFNGTNRAVAVYQHVRGRAVSDRVDQVIRAMPSMLHWASYESGTVAMLFFSLAPWKLEEITESMRGMLGRHAEKRVRQGHT